VLKAVTILLQYVEAINENKNILFFVFARRNFFQFFSPWHFKKNKKNPYFLSPWDLFRQGELFLNFQIKYISLAVENHCR